MQLFQRHFSSRSFSFRENQGTPFQDGGIDSCMEQSGWGIDRVQFQVCLIIGFRLR
ncbi:hypothetical protein CLOBOL_02154 [Enterocloster bolteae ATCC BAA-613]|uniref:Uncharacterized protein n=1 Tax=Enterocloster bolteae (strain ATCC BAA-613 / DSM 15670 / CCUG 46953 / JCM 12243 / WAL 16351) TaxID=411902 RepID=A8RNB4_ENTBW|nr:hypothetical protein CLOBOL_02154 [Enterocloster bolteae ATCC BAA-613]